MAIETELKPGAKQEHVSDHLAAARHLLKALEDRIGEHPELTEAITKLEMALNTLAVKTAGML
jgi:hypothetical protein